MQYSNYSFRGLKDEDPEDRNCYFADEVKLRLHNNYSQAWKIISMCFPHIKTNCIFCLRVAQLHPGVPGKSRVVLQK